RPHRPPNGDPYPSHPAPVALPGLDPLHDQRDSRGFARSEIFRIDALDARREHEAHVEPSGLVERKLGIGAQDALQPPFEIALFDRFDAPPPSSECLLTERAQQIFLVREMAVHRHRGKAGPCAYGAQAESLQAAALELLERTG